MKNGCIYKCLFVNVLNYDGVEKAVVPLGPLSLASLLMSKGIWARVIDLNQVYIDGILKLSENLKTNINETAELILKSEPNFVSLYTMSNTHDFAILIAKRIKKIDHRVIVVLGGPHATITAKYTLQKYNFIDGIGLGEGENNILGIVEGYKCGCLTKAKGIAYRDEQGIVERWNEELIEDLDKLPMLDYELLSFKPQESVSIDVGRGCPFGCTFCSTSIFWKRRYRIKSANRIFTEVQYLYENYGVRNFTFEHDIFVLDRKTVYALCDLIRKSNINITWGCSARIDTVDEDLLKNIAESGCISMYFGIETGSNRMQKLINKNYDLSVLDHLIILLDKYKIKPTFSLMYGFPQETEIDLRKTIELLLNLYEKYNKDFFNGNGLVQLHKLQLLPGTELHNKYKKLLVRSKFERAETTKDIGHWKSDELYEIIDDFDIFPQFFLINTELIKKYEHLDIFFMHIFIYTADYFNSTYHILHNYYDDILNMYNDIYASNTEKDIINTLPNGIFTILNVINASIKVLKNYVSKTNFGGIDELVKTIFDFELNVFEQLHNSKYLRKKYNYDVIKIKKSRGEQIEKKLCEIEFADGKIRYIL